MAGELSIATAVVGAAQVLRKAGVAEARREAGSLLAHVLQRDRTFLITHAEEFVNDADFHLLRRLVARRAAGEPLQYITNRQEFYKLEFEVTPDVLIPRPETELLVETALEILGDAGDRTPLVCDVGTGSGCVAISLLHEMPEARAVAVDISPPALHVAARNATRHAVAARLMPVASDCFAALDSSRAAFFVIVSNPPYIAEAEMNDLQREVRDYEPRGALTPGGDGLSIIRRLLADAPSFLRPGGHLLFEIGFNQHEAVSRLVNAQAWTLLDIRRDLQGIPRTVALRRER